MLVESKFKTFLICLCFSFSLFYPSFLLFLDVFWCRALSKKHQCLMYDIRVVQACHCPLCPMFLSTTSWRLKIPLTCLDLHHLPSPKPVLLVISQSASKVTCSSYGSRKQTDDDTCSFTEQLVGINLAVCRHPEYLNNELSVSLIMLATANQVVLFQPLPIYTVLV